MKIYLAEVEIDDPRLAGMMQVFRIQNGDSELSMVADAERHVRSLGCVTTKRTLTGLKYTVFGIGKTERWRIKPFDAA